jgi:S-formylglutathione hydrolase FrmB
LIRYLIKIEFKIKLIKQINDTDAISEASPLIVDMPDEVDNGVGFYAETPYTGKNMER